MADARPARRTIRAAQILLVVAAAGLWAASRLTWVQLRTFDGLGPPKVITLTGAGWSSALLPVAVLLLATALAALAVRSWALRALAVLLGLASLATGYLAISTLEMRDVAARGAELARVPVLVLVGSGRHYPGPVITLVAAVGTLIAAVLLMRAAASAGGTATKYLAPAARREEARQEHEAPSERAMWDELDEGRDPTDPDTEGR
ncbi:TIGR02234 family membrane protein [Candidatus Mycobacterium wuenschmannii]|uniref:TIGR02234 family membrane protein n=2 Tax=Candidatus Mycobacterium wuenschmannii TaxID=3027808 RepID=A0ABY8W1D9_9MYCO|nr:TIGR02234 family membrane protein [Candidatus Mycobacterium wuenschmannii]WIM88797.1 TIGR02234 family membrane protein [Candidatus Mycobacterium wuenschmannii]